MPRWLPAVLVALAALAVLLRLTVLAPEIVPVKVVAVERGRVESTVTNTKAGTVRARRRALISPEAGGRVAAVVHREGERVASGAPLVRLDDATQRAQLLLAQENLRVAQASHEQACIQRDRALRELERKRELAAQKILPDDLLDALESAYEAARAACAAVAAQEDQARAQIAASQVELEKTVLRAPFDGVIAEVAVEVGEWVTPSPPLLRAPPVIDLIDPGSVYISAPMDEVDSAAIRAGQRAKVSVDSHPGVELAGSVVRVAPYVTDVEAQNRTVEIEVELDDAELAATLLPGTSADVEVVLEVRDPVLRLPTTALLEGNRVLLAADAQLEERPVQIGIRNWDWAEVEEGLEEGQRVVVSLDRVEVKPGARVEVEEIEYRP